MAELARPGRTRSRLKWFLTGLSVAVVLGFVAAWVAWEGYGRGVGWTGTGWHGDLVAGELRWVAEDSPNMPLGFCQIHVLGPRPSFQWTLPRIELTSRYTARIYILPAWVLLPLTLVPTLLLWRRPRLTKLPGHCRQCGYDLTGNVSGRCPECGLLIPTSLAKPRVWRRVLITGLALGAVAGLSGLFYHFRPEPVRLAHDVEGLIAQLDTGNERLFEAAFAELGNRGKEPLLRLLESPQPKVRARAVFGLQCLCRSDPSVLPAIIRMLADPDPYPRFHAAEALGWIGDKSAICPLFRLRDDRGTGPNARRALQALGVDPNSDPATYGCDPNAPAPTP